VLSGRGLCDELITRPEESHRLWCVVVCDLENLKNEEAMTRVGSQRHRKNNGRVWCFKSHRTPLTVVWNANLMMTQWGWNKLHFYEDNISVFVMLVVVVGSVLYIYIYIFIYLFIFNLRNTAECLLSRTPFLLLYFPSKKGRGGDNLH